MLLEGFSLDGFGGIIVTERERVVGLRALEGNCCDRWEIGRCVHGEKKIHEENIAGIQS